MNNDYLNKLSEKLLLHVKLDKNTSEIRIALEKLNAKELTSSLFNDDKKKAFWINIYNAYFQILRIEQKIEKPNIYKKRLFKIAGQQLSLDDVEHGILRKNKYKYSLGFFNKIFISKFIKNNMVKRLDYRIHFALNCGAKSCPPIAFYNTEKIEKQLDLATQSFLESESYFNNQQKLIYTTTLFKWFFADFGGNKGIKRIFKKQLNKDITNYKIMFRRYSWDDSLNNFIIDK